METWGSSGDEITLLELNQFVGDGCVTIPSF